MKIEEKQRLSYKNLIFVSSLVGLLVFLIVPSWTRQRDEERFINARRQAEVVGYQVFEIYREAANAATAEKIINSRSPASMKATGGESLNFRDAGSIGHDPWGQPYRYKLLRDGSEQMKVQIWSAGPNRNFETSDKEGFAADVYGGDDVGVVLSLNHRLAEETGP